VIQQSAKYEFGTDKPDNALLGADWEPPKPDGVWSIGKRAAFFLPVPPQNGALILELRVDPQVTAATARKNTLAFSVNGKKIASRRLGGDCCWRIEIPARLIRDNALACGLHFTQSDKGADRFRLRHAMLLRAQPHTIPSVSKPIQCHPIGWNEPTEHLIGEGFGMIEDAYAWAIGRHSTAILPVPPHAPTHLAALIDLRPYISPSGAQSQRVAIGADEGLLGFVNLPEPLTLAFNLPPARGRADYTLTFDNFDASFETTDPIYHFGKPFACALSGLRITQALPSCTPASRPPIEGSLEDLSLQNSVEKITGLSIADLASKFESLGNCCDVARTQRRLGYHGSGLMTFGATWQPELVRAVIDGFAAIGDTTGYRWGVRSNADSDWRVFIQEYGFNLASPYPIILPPPANGFLRLSRIYSRLAEKTLAQMAAGETIFVLRMTGTAQGDTAIAAALAVWAAIRKWGNPKLLWLVHGAKKSFGSAERLSCGIVCGYLPLPPLEMESDEYTTSVLANAWMLFHDAD